MPEDFVTLTVNKGRKQGWYMAAIYRERIGEPVKGR